jgi:hypothetical protein
LKISKKNEKLRLIFFEMQGAFPIFSSPALGIFSKTGNIWIWKELPIK